MTLEQKYEQVQSAMPRLVKDLLQRAEKRLQPYIERYIDDEGPAEESFSSSDRIGAQSGAISRALVQGQRGHVSRYSGPSSGEAFTRSPAELVHGIDLDEIKHARRQELGGEFPATPRMIKYFWWRFIQTRFEKWRIIALAARKHGRIKTKARPYYEPGVADFEREEWPKMLRELSRRLTAQMK